MDNKFTVVTPFGEILRKRELIYTISGEDPRSQGFEMITDSNGELALKKNGIVYRVDEGGLALGGCVINRRLGGLQQRDIGEGAKELMGGVYLMGDRPPKEKKKKKKDKKK